MTACLITERSRRFYHSIEASKACLLCTVAGVRDQWLSFGRLIYRGFELLPRTKTSPLVFESRAQSPCLTSMAVSIQNSLSIIAIAKTESSKARMEFILRNPSEV